MNDPADHVHEWTGPAYATDVSIREPGIAGIVVGRCACGAVQWLPDDPISDAEALRRLSGIGTGPSAHTAGEVADYLTDGVLPSGRP